MSFHFNVADRIDYTCRLVRKATRAGAGVVLTGPVAALTHFDRALWTFDELEFIAHLMPRPGQPIAPGLRSATKVWLLEDASAAADHDVLVNLGVDAPAGFESFAKLIEIVTADPEDRSAARLRWKHYEARGYRIEQHNRATS